MFRKHRKKIQEQTGVRAEDAYLARHADGADGLYYDFLPEMIEIIEKPSHPAGKVIIWTVAACIVAVIVACSVVRTDVVVTAQGDIEPEQGISVVSTSQGGAIDSIDVRDGDTVRSGQTLMTLDDDDAMGQAVIAARQILVMVAQNNQYQKVLDGQDTDVTADSTDNQISGFLSATASQQADNIVLTADTSKQKQLGRNVSDVAKDIFVQHALKDPVLFDQLRSAARTVDASRTLLNVDADQERAIILQAMEQNASQCAQYQATLRQQVLAISRSTIVAPVSGVVSGLGETAVGTLVSSGTALLKIIPKDAGMVVDCAIPASELREIHVGSVTEIKVSAYPYSDYGVITGKITYLAPDSTVADTSSAASGNSNSGSSERGISSAQEKTYRARIALSKYPKSLPLRAGMPVEVEVKTGTRTIIGYFLDSLKKGAHDTFTQR